MLYAWKDLYANSRFVYIFCSVHYRAECDTERNVIARHPEDTVADCHVQIWFYLF